MNNDHISLHEVVTIHGAVQLNPNDSCKLGYYVAYSQEDGDVKLFINDNMQLIMYIIIIYL